MPNLIPGICTEVTTLNNVPTTLATLPIANEYRGILEIEVEASLQGDPAHLYSWKNWYTIDVALGTVTIRATYGSPIIIDPSVVGVTVGVTGVGANVVVTAMGSKPERRVRF